MTTSEQSMRMRVAAHLSWANTPDRSARTRAAREASHYTRFVTKAREMNPNGSEAEIADAAESLRKAHYTDLALKSAKARRLKGEAKRAAKKKAVDDEIAAYSAAKSA